MLETVVGSYAAAWLAGRDLAVHHEVVTDSGRIDLVGWRAGLVVVVECKLRPGLDVMAQAARCRGVANECWIATLRPKKWTTRERVELVCRAAGLGWLEVRPDRVVPGVQELDPNAHVAVPSQVMGTPKSDWLVKALHPDQLTAARAGTNGGGYSTPFSRTRDALVALVAEQDGVTVRDAVRRVEHHWHGKSPATTLARLLRDKPELFPGVRCDGNGTRATLHAVPPEQF